MSPWEIFTWFNAGVLALGPLIVFALFLKQLPTLLGRPDSTDAASEEGTDDSRE